jgi:FkbM family methyltransferase
MSLINIIKQFARRSGLWRVNYNKSYSQCGEDLIVDYVFHLRGIARPSYIDIGANHPYRGSNTALFYKKGCRGVNIEANPQLMPAFKASRPEDINLNVGISDTEGELEFYVMEDNTLSTFSKAERDHLVSNGKKLARAEKIRLTTVSKILSDHFNGSFPDFLTLDAEGMDFAILKSINFEKYSPKVICVEAAEYSPTGAGKRRTELIDFLAAKGFYEYANTNLNAIMVNRQFWFV